MDTNKFGVVACLYKDEVEFCEKDVVAWLDEGVVACLDKNNKDGFMWIFSFHNPWNILLSKTWVAMYIPEWFFE